MATSSQLCRSLPATAETPHFCERCRDFIALVAVVAGWQARSYSIAHLYVPEFSFLKREYTLSFFKFRVMRHFETRQAAVCENERATLRHLRRAQKNLRTASNLAAKSCRKCFATSCDKSRQHSGGRHRGSDVNLSPRLIAVGQMIPNKPSHSRGAYGPPLVARPAKTFPRTAALNISNLDRPA